MDIVSAQLIELVKIEMGFSEKIRPGENCQKCVSYEPETITHNMRCIRNSFPFGVSSYDCCRHFCQETEE